VAGREQLARQLATEADLLLFVVDNDLRRSEYQPLRTLAEMWQAIAYCPEQNRPLYRSRPGNDSGTVARTCAGV